MSLKRVLVISSDILPLPGFPTTGAGLRSWGIGKGLEARGHEVLLSFPAAYLDKGWEVPKDVAEFAWRRGGVSEVLEKAKPDVVVFSHWPSVQIGQKPDIPTVLDFHGPHMLEREFQGYATRATNAPAKVSAIRKADFFICAGEKQRLYFLSWLLAAGMELTDQSIASVLVSLSPELPTHVWSDDGPTFVYGGMFAPWQDPSAGLRGLIHSMESNGRGALKFFGDKHPLHDIGNLDRFETLVKELESSPRVQAMGLVTHDELIEEYRHAHVALDLMARNLERELAFTTRTVEYMWCGLPVIYQDYAELSGLIREYQAGWVVNPADEVQIHEAIEEALSQPGEVRRRGENAQRLVRECLTWDKTIEPLDAFCRNPWQREPVAMPMWPEPPGQPGHTLLGEVIHNYRHGGVRRVAYYTYKYLRELYGSS